MTRTNGAISGQTWDQVASILADLKASRTLSEQSFPRMEGLAERFELFVRVGLGKGSLAEVTAADASLFVTAVSSVGPPSVATMHLRRSMLRLLFRTARRRELVEGDPTLDLELPSRTNLRTRPLHDEEVALCRSASLHTLTSTRLAAACALSEVTARTAELPRLTVGDLDLARQRVWIHGGARTLPRWGQLSPWATAQLDRHLSRLPTAEPDQPLVYRGSGSAHSKQASACIVVGEVLVRAGLGGEPDVRPLSVTAWAGQHVLEETGRIEEVARGLGMRSLDRAARLIGFDWADK
jgi:integrase